MITCAFEDGFQVELRHVTVGCIVADEMGRILLVKRTPHLTNVNKYTLPGGFLDRNENTQEGALMELQEETGFIGKIISLFHIVDNPYRPKENRQNVEFRYLVESIGGEATLNDEASEIKWFSEDELPTEDDFAFDHRTSIERYFQYVKQPLQLPLLN